MKIKKLKFDLKEKVRYNFREEGEVVEVREGIISGAQILLRPREQVTRYMFFNTGDLVQEKDILKRIKC